MEGRIPFGRWMRRLGGGLLFLAGWVLVLLAIGIPGVWIPREWYNPPDQPLAPEVQRIRFVPWRGWILENGVLHLRGWPGPPLAKFESLTLEWKPGAWTKRGWGIDQIVFRNGTILLPPEYPFADMRGPFISLVKWKGRVVVENLDLWSQKIRRAEGWLSIQGHRGELEEMILECEGSGSESAILRGGGHVDFESGTYGGHFQWQGDPMAVARFLHFVRARHAVAVLQRFSFRARLLSGEAELEGRIKSPWKLCFETTAEGRDGQWGALPYEQFFLRLRYSGGKEESRIVRFEPLVWLNDRAVATANVEANLFEKTIQASGFFSGDPLRLLSGFPGVGGGITNRIRFEGPVRIQGSAVWNLGKEMPQSADLSFGMEKLVWRGMSFDRIVGRCQGEGVNYRIPEIRADCLGGVITGSVTLVFGASEFNGEEGKGGGAFFTQGVVSGVDLRHVAKEIRPGWESRNLGELSGHFALRGPLAAGWPRSIEGEGSVRIREGRLFRVPLFGFLTEWMARLIPGLDIKLSQTEATADWRVASGRVRAENLWVNGEWISVSARGAWDFSDELDGYAQIKLLKAESLMGKTLRAVSWPLSKLFEFRIRGSLSDPSWYPANFSMDLLDRLGMREEKGRGASLEQVEREGSP